MNKKLKTVKIAKMTDKEVIKAINDKELLKELAYKLIDPKYKTALMIFPLMVDKYAHIDGWLDLSHIQIAKTFRISEITSRRCMKLFHQLGLIRKQRRGLKQTNLYMFDWEILASIQNKGPFR